MPSQKLKSVYWRKCFPNTYTEVEYQGSKLCPLYLIIDIVSKFKNKTMSIEDIKRDLIIEYKTITENFTNDYRVQTIINILKDEGQYEVNQLRDNSMTFEQMIIQDGFVAVNFDNHFFD